MVLCMLLSVLSSGALLVLCECLHGDKRARKACNEKCMATPFQASVVEEEGAADAAFNG